MADQNDGLLSKAFKAIEVGLDNYLSKAKSSVKDEPAWDRRALLEVDAPTEQQFGWKERRGLVGPEVLKSMARKDSVIVAIRKTRLAQISLFTKPQTDRYSPGWIIAPRVPVDISREDKLKMTDPNTLNNDEMYQQVKYEMDVKRAKELEKQDKEIEKIKKFIMHCGSDDTEANVTGKRLDFNKFVQLIVDDRMIYNYAAIEKIPTKDRESIAIFHPVSSGTIRLVSKKSSDRYKQLLKEQLKKDGKDFKDDGKDFLYVQVVRGRIVAAWTEDQLIFEPASPTIDPEDNGYAQGELEQLVAIVTAHLYAESHNRNFFTQGIGTKGILHIKGDNINRAQLEAFKRQWFCTSPDSLIFTDQGVLPIVDLVDKDFKVWTGTSFEPAKAFETLMRPEHKTVLSNGLSIKTSPEHRFQVLNPEGQLTFIEQQKLQIGDFVTINRNANKDNIDKYTTVKINTELLNRNDVCPESYTIDEDMAEVLGWMVGDGTLYSTSKNNSMMLFYHPDHEEFIADRHLKILQDRGFKSYRKDVKADPKFTKYGYKPVVFLHSKPFIQSLLDQGFLKCSDGKTIPNSVFTWPESCRRSFLRGLISADGGLWKPNKNTKAHQIVFTSMQPSLRDKFYILLNSLGIAAKVTQDKDYRILIQDRKTFFDKIGFINPHKQEFEINENQDSKWDMLPLALTQKLAIECKISSKYENLSKEDRIDVCAAIRGDKNFSTKKAKRLFGNLPELSYRYVEVKEVIKEEKEVQMYDIQVFDNSNLFVCDGIVVHNSQVVNTRNAFRPPIIGIADDVKWVELAQSNKDMEFDNWMHYLIRICCAVFQIDPAEINFDISKVSSSTLNESSNEQRIKASRDKGLKPLLDYIENILNNDILRSWDSKLADKYEFKFVGLDAETRKEEIERLSKEVATWKTLNEARVEQGKEPIEDGDLVLNATYTQFKMQKDMAQQTAQQGVDSNDPNAQDPNAAQDQTDQATQDQDATQSANLEDNDKYIQELNQALGGVDEAHQTAQNDQKKLDMQAQKEKDKAKAQKDIKKSEPTKIEYYGSDEDDN